MFQTSIPASSSSTFAPSTVELYGCASSDIDTSTGACAHPVWVVQPSMLPPLDAASGIAIAVAVIACWALAYGLKSTQRAGD